MVIWGCTVVIGVEEEGVDVFYVFSFFYFFCPWLFSDLMNAGDMQLNKLFRILNVSSAQKQKQSWKGKMLDLFCFQTLALFLVINISYKNMRYLRDLL